MSYAPITLRAGALGLLIVALPLVALASPAQAQTPEQPARLQGVVVLESTFEPIADAVVTVIGTDIEAHTGPLGQFSIAEVPDGTAWVRVTAPGFPSVREQVDLSGDGVVFLQFRMPEDVQAILDDVLVDVWGPRLTNADAQSALDLLAAKMPGINMVTPGDVGNTDGTLRLRGQNTLTQNGNPLIVIDNVVTRGSPPLEVLSRIPASDVASIEVLRGPAAAFLYPYAADGVIAIKTKK